MLVVLRPGAAAAEALRVAGMARALGYHAEVIGAPGRQAVAVTGGIAAPPRAPFAELGMVERVEEAPNPYFLASRAYRDEDSVIDVAGVPIGGPRLAIIAGPCAVEDEEQLHATAEVVKKCGLTMLRAGAYKLRTSPWAFQGLEQRGLDALARVKRATGLRIVTEVVSESTVDAVAEVADMIQVGARNMKSYALLKRVGSAGRPVLLKRGPEAQVSELLLSAEYLLAAGCPGVALCERGIRTFADHARNTLDLSAVPAVKRLSHLPILVDPSHGTGSREMVLPLSRAAVAVGADGLLVEVHPDPERALSDGPQALRPEDLARLVAEVSAIALAVGRK